MRLSVEIDPRSGFCGGVIRAIAWAEKYLEEHPGGPLCSLGALVHNEEEMQRLGEKGLRTIERLEDAEGGKVLIRAHGEPPGTYRRAGELGLSLIDRTCPVVLRLQQSIREAYERVGAKGGKIVIFGRIGHAEVLGLQGQADGGAVVVESVEMLDEAIAGGEIPLDKPVEIFSQTTGSPEEFRRISSLLREKNSRLTVHETICAQVSSRYEELAEFASGHDVVVFASGRKSSNGKVLFELCRRLNSRSHQISSASEIDPSWFRDGDGVGVCGATSTPKWLLTEIADKILQLP